MRTARRFRACSLLLAIAATGVASGLLSALLLRRCLAAVQLSPDMGPQLLNLVRLGLGHSWAGFGDGALAGLLMRATLESQGVEQR